MTDEESVAVDTLEGEIDDLAAILEDEETSDEARDEAEAKIRDLSDRIDAIVNKTPIIDDDLKPRVGAFLVLDEQGRPRLDSSLYAEISPDGDVPAIQLERGGNSAGASEKVGRAGGLSQRLVDELAMQRRDILAVHIAADPGLALDLAIFLMIDREAGHSCEKSGSSLAPMPPSDPVFGFKTPEAPATITRADASDALDRSWTEGKTRAERFDAFRALAEEARAAWLGHAVARTLEASLNLAGQRSCAFHDHLGQLLGIDVARWWRPTGANYFDRVPKSVTLAALAEVGGPELAGRYASAKKAELAQTSERIFSGDFIGEVEVKEAALAWVPEAMRFARAPVSAEPAGPEGEAGAGAEAADDSEVIDEEASPSAPVEQIEEAA